MGPLGFYLLFKFQVRQAERRPRMHQHGNKYQQRFQEAAKAEEPQEKLGILPPFQISGALRPYPYQD